MTRVSHKSKKANWLELNKKKEKGIRRLLLEKKSKSLDDSVNDSVYIVCRIIAGVPPFGVITFGGCSCCVLDDSTRPTITLIARLIG